MEVVIINNFFQSLLNLYLIRDWHNLKLSEAKPRSLVLLLSGTHYSSVGEPTVVSAFSDIENIEPVFFLSRSTRCCMNQKGLRQCERLSRRVIPLAKLQNNAVSEISKKMSHFWLVRIKGYFSVLIFFNVLLMNIDMV